MSDEPTFTVPERFRGYKFDPTSALDCAELSVNESDRAEVRQALYDGYIRQNEYDEHGRQTFGRTERQIARDAYINICESSRGPDAVDLGFDWAAWREEYDAGIE